MNPAYWAIGISISLVIAAIGAAWRYGVWRGKVDSDRTNFQQFMQEVRADIKQILGRLPPPPPVSASSPLRLTDLGRQISQDTGAEKWAESAFAELLEEIEGKDPFGIQTIAFDYANQFAPSDGLLAKMRNSAFDNGLDLEGVRRVLGVVLRDLLLRERGLLPSPRDGQD